SGGHGTRTRLQVIWRSIAASPRRRRGEADDFGLPLDEEAGYHVPMTLRDAFPEITRLDEPLAPFTGLRVGGPAEFLVRPRSVAELAGVLKFAADNRIPARILGAGSNILVRDEGVRGAVVRLSEPAFTTITVEG